MKGYRVEGKYSQAIFYVGLMKDVEETLLKFFEKHPDGVKSSKAALKYAENEIKPESEICKSKLSKQKGQKSQRSELRDFQKYLSLHILLFDLSVVEYNIFKSKTIEKFSEQIRTYRDSITINFAIIQSREESLRYIKKIEKYTEPEFQSNLDHLNQELQENAEYELVREYLREKFDMSREEVFSWMQSTSIRTFKELLTFKYVPNFQKKELRQLLSNLTLLQSLYQNEEGKIEKKVDIS